MKKKIEDYLNKNLARKLEIEAKLKEDPYPIDRYIKLLEYLKADELTNNIKKTELELQIVNIIYK